MFDHSSHYLLNDPRRSRWGQPTGHKNHYSAFHTFAVIALYYIFSVCSCSSISLKLLQLSTGNFICT